MAKINKTLNELKEVLSSEEIEEIKLERFSTKAGIKLWVLFNQVTDPRVIGRSKYPLGEVLLLVFFAVLAGANTWVDIAAYGESKLKLLRKITEYTHGTPSHDEIRYIFGLIDPLEFQNVVMNFLRDNIQHLRKCMHLTDPGPDAYRHWAIDGKEERGTGRHYNTRIGGKVRNIQTLHVWDATDEICIYSEKIDEKTNEIPVAQRFLRSQDTLENTLITCDALHTQKVTTQIIIKKDGDYVLGLKGNQTGLLEDATAYFDEETLKAIRDGEVDYYTETEKAHSQIEKREYFLVRPEPDSERDKEWSGISSYVCCRKTITPLDGSQATVETRYYVASIDDIRLCASAIRQHWFCLCEASSNANKLKMSLLCKTRRLKIA